IVLRTGGVGGTGLTGRDKGIGLKSALSPEDKKDISSGPPKHAKKRDPIPSVVENARADRLSNEFIEARGTEQKELIAKLEKEKGVDNTEALALAIPRLEGQTKQKAREALANRFTRLKPDSLLRYIEEDPDPEIRRAAVLASAMRDLRAHIPAIIERLKDSEPAVVRAAHAALKTVTGEDFGPSADATREEHAQARAARQTLW